jgi:hypothetical protein
MRHSRRPWTPPARRACAPVLVGGGEFQVLGARRAQLQELDLDLADAAADLQDAGPLDADLLQELDRLLRGGVEAALAVAVGEPAGEPLVEEAVVVTGGTAACHGGECSGALPGPSLILGRGPGLGHDLIALQGKQRAAGGQSRPLARPQGCS